MKDLLEEPVQKEGEAESWPLRARDNGCFTGLLGRWWRLSVA